MCDSKLNKKYVVVCVCININLILTFSLFNSNMSFSEGNISSTIGGGSYSIKSKFDEAINKLSNISKRVKELESMMVSFKLSPNEVIPENLPEGEDKNKVITPENYKAEGIFVISIPPELLKELGEIHDIEYSLRVTCRKLAEAYEEEEKQKGHVDHRVSSSLF